MSFVLGAVLFLLGGFLGMLTMSIAIAVRDTLPNDDQTTLRIVQNND
jgi:hypothetical protein